MVDILVTAPVLFKVLAGVTEGTEEARALLWLLQLILFAKYGEPLYISPMISSISTPQRSAEAG